MPDLREAIGQYSHFVILKGELLKWLPHTGSCIKTFGKKNINGACRGRSANECGLALGAGQIKVVSSTFSNANSDARFI